MEIEKMLEGCLIAIDKPRGPPSAQVGNWVRDILGVRKSGHIGTLDPKVSGVLLVALGKAVKLSKFLSGQDKEYIAVMHLHKPVDEIKIRSVVSGFRGSIMQKPPLRSAVAKRIRARIIHEIEILETDLGNNNVLIRVSCEGGTYIRKLIYDMGKKLGTGANMLELRRIRSGDVREDAVHTLYDLKDAVWLRDERDEEEALRGMLIPPEDILPLKKIVVKDSAVPSIAYGAPIYRKGLSSVDDELARGDYAKIFSESGMFCGIARIEDGPELYAKIDVNWLDAKEFQKQWKNAAKEAE